MANETKIERSERFCTAYEYKKALSTLEESESELAEMQQGIADQLAKVGVWSVNTLKVWKHCALGTLGKPRCDSNGARFEALASLQIVLIF